jgi:hypothetical protein
MLSSSLHSFLDEDLRFHLYKIHTTQELKEQDKASHVNFWRQFLDLVDNDRVLDVLILSDGVHFYLSGYINTILDTGAITILRRSIRKLSTVLFPHLV